MFKNIYLTIIYAVAATITATLTRATAEVQGAMVTMTINDPDIFSFKTFTAAENIPAPKPKPKP